MSEQLSERDREVLLLASKRYRYAGRRESDIRERFDWSEIRFWQVVHHLIDTAAAEATFPVEVHRLRRLRRLRDERRRARTERAA